MAKADSPGYLSTYLNMGATAQFHFDNGYTLQFQPKRKKMRTGSPASVVTLTKGGTVVGTWDMGTYDKFLPALKVIIQLIQSDVITPPNNDDTTGKEQAWS